ncbi:prophage antirepressor-like protein [Paraburkholderia bannensis]|uniref:Prophage antirepressor-like protein n=1 Tax=Paraburkholderia bannensis TaxID=765414 RepID=A0A7W9WRD3_9BURK|nr:MULTISPECIES: Bro-N domain-containing protein [Paraburkholderia]MBB3255445.1 prophage antirepressor-like protein [Paraburkholderia sp. WP4_3_2]MBB6100543.1 prophage antirepressor-like protein [Paraburkholderia bannensis]
MNPASNSGNRVIAAGAPRSGLHLPRELRAPDVLPFSFDGAAVRVVTIDGEPWFVTRDLCSILGIRKAEAAMRGLEASEKGATTISTLGGPQKLNICNESGMYALIFNSRKPEARTFRQWVTSEVLPSIRKTGRYAAPSAPQTPPRPQATVTGDLALAEAAARMLNVSQSGRVTLLTRVAKIHGLSAEILPRHAIDAPSDSNTGSSEATSSATDLLKAHGSAMNAARFNAALARLGYMHKRMRKTSQKARYPSGEKAYWVITQHGLAYGKNVVDAQSPRETQPQWFVSRFADLLEIVRNADEEEGA